MREVIESVFIRMVLSLPMGLCQRLFGTGPENDRGIALHPGFVTLLGLLSD